MPDNTSLGVAVGDGDDIRTIEKGAAKTQAVLIDKGGTGSESLVTDANPLPVVQTGTPALPTGASSLAEQQTQSTALAAIEAAVKGAIPAGTNNIGDVDVASLPAGSVAGVTAKTADYDSGVGTDTVPMFGVALPASGGAVVGGTSSNPLRTDPTGTTTQPVSVAGTVAVDGSAVTQPVSAASLPLPSGAATSAAQSTGNTALAAIQTAVQLIDNAVLGSEFQVDVVGPLPAGTNNIGDVDVLSVVPGTAATSLGKAVDAVAGATDTGVAPLAVRDDALAALTPIEGDYVPLRVDANGALWTHDDALDAAIAGSELQVDVVAPLPAGTNNIGDVDIASALPAGTNNIGDVDLASAIPAGTNNIGDVDIASIAAGDNNIGNVDVASTVPLSTVEASDTLGALDAVVTLAIQGRPYVGITFTGALTANLSVWVEYSTDNGVTWDERSFFNGDDVVVVDVLPHAIEDRRDYILSTQAADTDVRLRVLTYSSGSIVATVRASGVVPPSVLEAGMYGVQAAPTTLDALNETLEMGVGTTSLGFYIQTSTLDGTIVIESSPVSHGDIWPVTEAFFGGNAWRASWDDPTAGVIYVALGAAVHRVRLRISAYTSGSILVHGRGSSLSDVLAVSVHTGLAGLSAPFFAMQVAGQDGSGILRGQQQRNATPAATDYGLVTRNLPLKSATATAHASTAVEGTVVTLLAANAARKRFMVQNAGTIPVKLGFGTTDPTATSYHIALAGSTGADDGTGGIYTDDMWTGAVEAIGATGGKVVVTELT